MNDALFFYWKQYQRMLIIWHRWIMVIYDHSSTMVTWSPSDCSKTISLNPSTISAFNYGLASLALIFMENSWDGLFPSFLKYMKLSWKLIPITTISFSSKFHPTISFLFMTDIEWWKEMAVPRLFPFWPIRYAPEPLP